MVVESLRHVDLLESTSVHDRDPVAHRHRLGLVVRDVESRRLQTLVQRREVGAHLDAQLRVEVRQRLVHQEGVRLTHDRPAHRNPLALSARKLSRLPLEQVVDPQHGRRRGDPRLDLALPETVELEPEGHVLVDGHVRVQRVALEDHGDVPVHRRKVVDQLVADPDLAARRLLEPRRDPQHGRLPGAGRADEHHELAVGDLEVQRVDGLGPAGEHLRQLSEVDPRHAHPPPSVAAIRSLYQSALRFGIRRWVGKSTKTIPNRFSYPCSHSKLSSSDQT